MLAIRLQRLGRKAAPVYRVAVQESQRHPSSGRVVAYVGAYNPHTKQSTIDKDKAEFYLKNGAQPTPRVVRLFKDAKVSLPAWVKAPRTDKANTLRNPDKLRKNQPKDAAPTEEANEKEEKSQDNQDTEEQKTEE